VPRAGENVEGERARGSLDLAVEVFRAGNAFARTNLPGRTPSWRDACCDHVGDKTNALENADAKYWNGFLL
jgi:hypothetical protein